MRALLRVMAKPATAGNVKTRLQPPLDGREAAALAEALLADTVAVCRQVAGARVDDYQVRHASLGAALAAAASAGLRIADRVLLIAPDTIGLRVEHLVAALDALRAADAVLGPSSDGGYYVLGVRTPFDGVLDAVALSTPTALADSARALEAAGLAVAILVETLDDCDDAGGLAGLLDGVAGAHVRAAAAAMPDLVGRLRQLSSATRSTSSATSDPPSSW